MESMCRTCLSSRGVVSLETKNDGELLSVREMLLSFCTLNLNDNNLWESSMLCKECAAEVHRAYTFKVKCEQNDYVLSCRVKALKNETKEGIVFKEESVETESAQQSLKEEPSFIIDFLDPDIKVEHYNDSDGVASDRECTPTKSYSKRTKRKGKRTTTTSDAQCRPQSISHQVQLAKSGRPGRKKRVRPLSEFTDDASSTLGYKKVYECPKCHAFFKTFRMMNKHIIKLHEVILESLNQYNSMFPARPDQEKSSKMAPQGIDFKKPKYKCLDCWHLSKNFDALKKHIIEEHRGERYIHCDECDYTTTHLTMLVRHKRIHSGERRFACPDCSYRSTSNYQLNMHIAAHHSTHKAFVCDACAKAFKTKVSLVNHMTRVHINKREHLCPICNKGFNMKKDLNNHSLVHSGQKPHVCEHCGSAFSQRANLEKHVRVVHINTGERPHPCPECAYKAKSIYALKSHMYKHNMARRFACHICNHKTVTKYALKTHIQRHLGDKRFHCKSCSYSCYDARTLVVHSRIHTGERPFPCNLCPYRSRTKSRLHNHMKSHLNEQKYSCQHCPYRSNYKANLVVHLKKNCGRDSRPYTPRKSQAAVNVALTATETITQSHNDVLRHSSHQQNTMKVELGSGSTLVG